LFISWDAIKQKGFAFTKIQKNFSEKIQQNKIYTVVGKYIDNIEISLISGQKKTIPILSECYVEAGRTPRY
jgi:hypothetical protein